MKLTHNIHAEQYRCKWLLKLLTLPKSTQSSLDHKVPDQDDEDEDDEDNDVLWWWWVTVSCWWGTFMLWWGIYISKSISGLGREEEIPCVSWWHVSAEAKERFLAQQVSEVEKIQLYLLQKIEAWGKSEVEDRRLMKREAQRKEAKDMFLVQNISCQQYFRSKISCTQYFR